MQVIDSTGRVLDAAYSVVPYGSRLALIMESRSGKSGNNPGRNSEYNPALVILLERLGRCDATMLDAFVDSKKTQNLGTPEDERRIVQGPIKLAAELDKESLRLRMGRAQARIAQATDATKGGNAT